MLILLKRKYLLIISLFLFLLISFFPYPLLAQQEQAITISPLVFDLSSNPGDVLTDNLRVYNPGSEIIKVIISVEDFQPRGEAGSVEIIEPDQEIERISSLAKWVEVEPKEFELKPREEQIVKFKIMVPLNAEPGGKYGSLVATVVSRVGPEATGAAIAQKVASLLLLSVAGEVEEKLIVREFKGPSFQEYGPINFNLRLENQGTVHLRPRGFVAITSWQNKKVADLSIPQLAVMPGAKRIIEIKWDKKNLFGRFTATLIGNYGSTNEPLQAVWTFWVWPWRISLIILIVVVLFLILLLKGRKRIGAALRVLFKGEMSQ